MHNKTELIIDTLLSELKQKPEIFGGVTYAKTTGFNFATAEITTKKDSNTDIYRVIVVKQAN
jgi:hypothetical protein